MDLASLPDFVVPLLAAVLAGGLIGFEREWRGRAAGLRTHILVCLASALLMEAAVSQGAWRFHALPGTEIVSDPTRMAHGVLTGIGFLCAGVIFRAGFSIHGQTRPAPSSSPIAAVIHSDAEVTWRREDPSAEVGVEAALGEGGWSRRGERHELVDGGESVRRTFRIRAVGDEPLKALAARLRTVEGVTGYRLDPRDD